MNEFIFSGGEKFFFWLLKHFNKKLLKKFFPLNENDLQIKFENMPNIYINEQINHCNITFSIGLKNYTYYDLFLSFIQIQLVINDSQFLDFDKIILKSFNKKAWTQLNLNIPLTYYQVQKILLMTSKGGPILNAYFKLIIPSKNVLGELVFDRQLFEKIEVTHIPN